MEKREDSIIIKISIKKQLQKKIWRLIEQYKKTIYHNKEDSQILLDKFIEDLFAFKDGQKKSDWSDEMDFWKCELQKKRE